MRLEFVSIVTVVSALFGQARQGNGKSRYLVGSMSPIFYPVDNSTRFRHHDDDYGRRRVQGRAHGHQVRYHRRQYSTNSK